jgi:hypothetical protein
LYDHHTHTWPCVEECPIDVKDGVAMDLLIARWSVGSFLQDLEGNHYRLYLFLKSITGMRELNVILLCSVEVPLLHGFEDPSCTPQGMRDPAQEGRLVINTHGLGILHSLNGVGLLELAQRNPHRLQPLVVLTPGCSLKAVLLNLWLVMEIKADVV